MQKDQLLDQLKANRLQAMERYYNGSRIKEQAEKDLAVLDTAIEAINVATSPQPQAQPETTKTKATK